MAVPKESQKAAFESIRSAGILKTNTEEAGNKYPKFERARRTEDGFFFISPKSMSKHASIRNTLKSFTDIRLLARPSVETSNLFKENILATLRNDEAGRLAKTDSTILLIEYWAFQKLKKK